MLDGMFLILCFCRIMAFCCAEVVSGQDVDFRVLIEEAWMRGAQTILLRHDQCWHCLLLSFGMPIGTARIIKHRMRRYVFTIYRFSSLMSIWRRLRRYLIWWLIIVQSFWHAPVLLRIIWYVELSCYLDVIAVHLPLEAELHLVQHLLAAHGLPILIHSSPHLPRPASRRKVTVILTNLCLCLLFGLDERVLFRLLQHFESKYAELFFLDSFGSFPPVISDYYLRISKLLNPHVFEEFDIFVQPLMYFCWFQLLWNEESSKKLLYLDGCEYSSVVGQAIPEDAPPVYFPLRLQPPSLLVMVVRFEI